MTNDDLVARGKAIADSGKYTGKSEVNGQGSPWPEQMEPDDPGLTEPPPTPPTPPTPSTPEGDAMPRVWRAMELRPAAQSRWLAKGRLQRGSTNLLVGDEGIGMSLLWVWIAAAVTTGQALPGFGIPARNPAPVLLVCTEDDWCYTVRPRLEVAGADLSMVCVVCVERDGSGADVPA